MGDFDIKEIWDYLLACCYIADPNEPSEAPVSLRVPTPNSIDAKRGSSKRMGGVDQTTADRVFDLLWSDAHPYEIPVPSS